MDDLIIVPSEEVEQKKVDITGHLEAKPKKYEVKENEISQNIQKFDRKVKKLKVFTENPYSYNSVSLKREKAPVAPNQSASTLITDPVYNTIGKFLGVDTIHDWNRDYDKVYAIVEWAKAKSGEKNLGQLMRWIGSQARRVPNVGNKNIDNLYIFARLYLSKK